jgi:hypothetical protein
MSFIYMYCLNMDLEFFPFVPKIQKKKKKPHQFQFFEKEME